MNYLVCFNTHVDFKLFWVVSPLCNVVLGYQRFFTQRMEAACSYETLVPYHNSEQLDLNLHHREHVTSV
jgi:hypothetical protein